MSRFQQKKKLERPEMDLSGEQLKRWVINLSKYKLKDCETKLLARGLGFAISPDKIPVSDIVIGTEVCCQRLTGEGAEQCRAEVVGLIKSCKIPKDNINKYERKALKDLRMNKEITILPADKGKAVVLMDADSYKEKCKLVLSEGPNIIHQKAASVQTVNNKEG